VTDVFYAADNWIGSTIEASSFSGLLTRLDIGHIRIGSDGKRGYGAFVWPGN